MRNNYLVKNDDHLVYSKPKYGEDKFVVIDDYNIHYVEIGKGQTILLIPGSFCTYRNWNRIIPFLSKDYKLLAFDYIGVGDSDKPSSGFGYTIEEQANLFAKSIKKLKILKTHIIGVSYGGAVALNLAARYSSMVGKIVCIEGAVFQPKKLPFTPMTWILGSPLIGDLFIWLVRYGLLDIFKAKFILGNVSGNFSSEEKKEIMAIISQNNKTADRFSWYHISRTNKTSKDFAEKAKTIQNPVLYLYGENSVFRDIMINMTLDFLKYNLPKVEIVCIKNGIHDLELQKPKQISSMILTFLNKKWNQ